MTQADRRDVLRRALGCALLPLLATRAGPVLATGGELAAIIPPTAPMIYRRMILRELPGGVAVKATRDFAVRFAAADNGFLLSGSQVRAEVQAPAALAAVARLEEQRVESGVFPLSLDRHGRIVDGRIRQPDAAVAQAMVALREHLVQSGPEGRELSATLPADGHLLTATLPTDLFAPHDGVVEQREVIALPWGASGEVQTRFTATRDPATRLMRLAMREVLTTLDGQQRRTLEQWELFTA